MTRLDVVADGGRDEDAPRTADPLAPDSEPEDLLGEMLRAGVLTDGDDGDLYLTDEFEAAWTDEMETLRALDHAALIEATAQTVPFEATGERAYGGIRVEGEEGVAWLRPANAIADVAAVRAMDGLGVPAVVQAPAASPLRLFTPECPVCGADLVSRRSTDGYKDGAESNRRVLGCVDCGAEVHELSSPVDGDAATEQDA
ncbi:hypothetical protein [Halobaculum marinum]|uniref:DUF8054 domain-containing protein n=1 Tax=Halobaculum marinum TaxID=3031996 RepID=A0ABD5WY22_9EURY|nr:hypothetical protein [Halobaculum sp. DT55]